MKLNKVLKIFSVIFECSAIGNIVLYIYNFYMSSKKYEIMPEKVKTNLNIFMIAAIISLILFLIIKYVLYLRNKTDNVEEIETEPTNSVNDNVIERVIIHKDSYEVPKERRALCPNCKNIVDKNAVICLKCGFLLKEIVKEKVIEKHIYEKNNSNINSNIIRKKNTFDNVDKRKLKNVLINVGLGIAIVICLILIISMAIERGII